MNIVRALAKIVPRITSQFTYTLSVPSYSTAIVAINAFLIHAKVIAIPPTPDKIPTGIPIAPSIKPSKYTDILFCFLVAPTDESIPRYFALS